VLNKLGGRFRGLRRALLLFAIPVIVIVGSAPLAGAQNDYQGGRAARGEGGGGLAFTGQDTGILVGIALALMVLGLCLYVGARRRSQARSAP
jgi:hypothetical protein